MFARNGIAPAVDKADAWLRLFERAHPARLVRPAVGDVMQQPVKDAVPALFGRMPEPALA